ncbi:unnamed protein product [Brachionus calyciflorus]|uniref:Uncharacterized protein n=1 Tax=Brachionus calyciflorus TaxID=104777 RepID=A0A813Z9N6_9BILA|nr:unnamed protein product [Brachionus calyciflorus]
MGSNLNYDGDNVDYDEFYKAFGYDAAMYGLDSVQQAASVESRRNIGKFARDLGRLVDKGLPGLEANVKSKLLNARLVSCVPETTKTFSELLSDKNWALLIVIFENQVDYRTVIPGHLSQEVVINKMDQRQPVNGRRFN